MVVFMWAFVANNITYNQRMKVIHGPFSLPPDWISMPYEEREEVHQYAITASEAYSKVTYETHLWRVFTFRSPWAAYPQVIQEWSKK